MTGLHSTELEPEKWRVPGRGQGSQGLCSGKEVFSTPIFQRKNNIISIIKRISTSLRNAELFDTSFLTYQRKNNNISVIKSISKSLRNGELFDQNFLILLTRKKYNLY
jgi:hypothetical protein